MILCQSICLRRVQTKSRENSAVLHFILHVKSFLGNVIKAVERPIASNGGTVISCISEEYLVLVSFKTNIGIQMIFRDAFEIKNDVKERLEF